MGLYSALITIPLMLVVGLCFRVPGVLIYKLEKAESIKEVKEVYRKMAPRVRCRRACGFVLFTLLSCFFSIYLIAFGEIVRAGVDRSWA